MGEGKLKYSERKRWKYLSVSVGIGEKLFLVKGNVGNLSVSVGIGEELFLVEENGN